VDALRRLVAIWTPEHAPTRARHKPNDPIFHEYMQNLKIIDIEQDALVQHRNSPIPVCGVPILLSLSRKVRKNQIMLPKAGHSLK
jgi:hypothetical protein